MPFHASSNAPQPQAFHLIVDHRVRAKYQSLDDALTMASSYLGNDKEVSLAIISLGGGIFGKEQIVDLIEH